LSQSTCVIVSKIAINLAFFAGSYVLNLYQLDIANFILS